MAGPGVELATAWVRLVPSMDGVTGQITKGLGGVDTRKIGKSVGGKFASNIGAGIKSVATGTVAAASAVLGTAIVKGLGRLKALDQANQKLLGLGHSSKAVKRIMGDALSSVRGTAFGMGDAATVAASTVAAGVKPGKDLEHTLSLVADAATIAGTDMGSMGAIFNKVAAGNRVRLREINQLHAAGIPALSAIAKHMGVTTTEASKMVTKGKIDFKTFQAAMEDSLGGAAKRSGDTFSGAMANVGASIGRIGANLFSGIFPKLAPLFKSVTTALGPLEDQAAKIGDVIGSKLGPAIDWVTTGLNDFISGLTLTKAEAADLGAPLDGLVKVGFGLKESFSNLKQIIAPLGAAFVALGSSGLAPLVKMVPGLGGLASKLAFLGGPVGLAVAAFAGLVAVSPDLRDALGGLMDALGAAGSSLAPVLQTVAQVLSKVLMGAIAAAIPVIVGVVDVFAGFVGWLTDSQPKITALTVVVGVAVGAWAAYRLVLGTISFVKFIAGLYSTVAAFTASAVAKVKDAALTAAIIGLYARDFVVAAYRAVAGVVASTAAWVANTAALIASKAVMVAVRAAMIVATAAQWAWNAALSANPIGIIIVAVAALVAALVWFFTQTDLGRKIWSGFITWLQEAWQNTLDVAVTVWTAVSDFFKGLWNGIRDFTVGLWNGIVSFIRGVWSGFTGWIKSIVSGLASWWNGIWSSVGSFFSGLWSRIVNGVRSRVQAISTVIRAVVGGISAWWRSTWSSISSFFSGLWNGIVSTVRGVGRAFGSVFGGIRSAVSNAFKGIVGIVRGPVNGIIGLVNGAIHGLNRLHISIPDWVPVVGGQNWGLSIPTIPMLADGATVLPRNGGTLAVLAEAGRPESVVDTGLLNRALEQGLAGNGSAGITVQGPLVQVDQMVVDSDGRVDEVAKALYERSQRAARAGGGINLGGAVTA